LSLSADPKLVKQFIEDVELLLTSAVYSRSSIAKALKTHKGNISNYLNEVKVPGKIVIARFYEIYSKELERLCRIPPPRNETIVLEPAEAFGGKANEDTATLLASILQRQDEQDKFIKELFDKLEKIESKLPKDNSSEPEK
jgi:hypothetical protein